MLVEVRFGSCALGTPWRNQESLGDQNGRNRYELPRPR
jgi:hypothetical protein